MSASCPCSEKGGDVVAMSRVVLHWRDERYLLRRHYRCKHGVMLAVADWQYKE